MTLSLAEALFTHPGGQLLLPLDNKIHAIYLFIYIYFLSPFMLSMPSSISTLLFQSSRLAW